jgi:hypothetical protein
VDIREYALEDIEAAARSREEAAAPVREEAAAVEELELELDILDEDDDILLEEE